ncbi:MAG: hypothetical protein K6T55_00130 [Syntrophobacterales bacterium]|nr:hypothetical protein [Syntrophobacterales bacterium]
MPFDLLSRLWQAWRRPARPRPPAWGDQPPVIVGICRLCGAVVLDDWQVADPEGCLCRRCHSARSVTPGG